MVWWVCAIALGAGGDVFLIEPAVDRWEAVTQAIAEKQVRLARHRRLLARRSVTEAEHTQYAGLARIGGSEEAEITAVLTTIEDLAGQAGVRITDIKPQPVRTVDFYKYFGVELEAEAAVQPLMQFIYRLQTAPQVLKVDRLRLSAKTGGSNLLRAEFLISRIGIP